MSHDPSPHRAPRAQLQSMFLGPYGLRAGWRLLIFVALLIALFGFTIPLQRLFFRTLGQDFSARNVALSEIFYFALVFLVSAAISKFERRRLGDYGLPARGMFGKNFWSGALWGFTMLSAIIVLMVASHAYSFGGSALAPMALLKFGLLWAFAFLMVGFFEEFAFRGYAQFTLTWGMGFWPATAVTCLIFALGHYGNPGETWVGVVEIVLIALFLCVALRRTGNLWFAIGWHMAFDWGESFFYSTPNSGMQATGHMFNASLLGSKWLSGGTVGPEGSVFDLLVTVAGILLLARIYPDAKYPAVLPEPVTPVAASSLPSIIASEVGNLTDTGQAP